jgi:hypothetical protein
MKTNNQQATIQSSLIPRLCRLTASRATRISSLRDWSNLSCGRNAFLAWMAALALVCCPLSPLAGALTPAPDGGYPGANTAEGELALSGLTTGFYNTATGHEALFFDSSGSANTATGSNALIFNTIGANNTATGSQALNANDSGGANTATGVLALYSNDANYNTATGYAALYHNTSGINNMASGVNALTSNVGGSDNTAGGFQALFTNSAGNNNTATGFQALFKNATGGSNTAEGFEALANTTGSFNIALGNNAGLNLTAGSNNIDIGNLGVAGESGKIRIGTKATQTATFIAGISGKTVASGVGVIINSAGQLGVATSSARFKEAIKPMDKVSEAILAFTPVTFRYKQELDPEGIPQFGLIAEEVEKVNPQLVARDDDGKVTTVRYDAVNAMLLNEFLKEHRQVQELKGTVAQQRKQIEALTATVQRVSDQIALGKPAPQLVANP